ncbi:hypothetical protein DYB32_001011 [Aphanomyces invadans]|uniref:ATP-dependent DNA helicase n=1 Tax=Aphanomyces invadans TaxID=157072 RepID=A0A418B832_9STRA|nr:hypothetical protein DYB32_001011 [Aphanomyces invadans]
MKRAKFLLRDVFGHSSYRPGQERIVQEALSGKDVFVLMPTGGGKSLCYQLPACVDDGVSIVISPLVSLIEDQTQQLQALDVNVALLNGDQDYETVQRPIISQLFSNNITIKMLYVTPEKIASSGQLGKLFESLASRKLLARFVVDEAHCISQWGHDFRKDYMNLGTLRIRYPNVPIMALTATANSQTETDIVKNLRLSNPFVTRTSFNRYESGRAGRDGEHATCLLYYSFKDLSRRRNLIAQDRDNLQHQTVHFQNLRRMVEFCENQVECRRTSLLEYFGEHFSNKNCHQTCDNCKARSNGAEFEKKDVTADCLKIYNIGKTSSSEKKNVMGFSSNVLVAGSQGRKLVQGETVALVCKTKRQQLISAPPVSTAPARKEKENGKSKKAKAPAKQSTHHNVVHLTEEDNDVIDMFPVMPHARAKPMGARVSMHHVEALHQLLMDWRASVCDNFDVMPYHILPTSGIVAISEAVPITCAELMAIEGVGRTRVKKWGEAIIEIVKSYLTKKPPPRDEFDDGMDWAIVGDIETSVPAKRTAAHATIDLSRETPKRKKV